MSMNRSQSVRLSPPTPCASLLPTPHPGLRMQAAPSATADPVMTSLPLKVEFWGISCTRFCGGGRDLFREAKTVKVWRRNSYVVPLWSCQKTHKNQPPIHLGGTISMVNKRLWGKIINVGIAAKFFGTRVCICTRTHPATHLCGITSRETTVI